MIPGGLLLLFAGIGLSAFFSGSETGFYRASRLRIVMDAMEGDRTAKRLLFLTNRPPLFVATALVGNNSANYLTSMAIVLLTQTLSGSGVAVELAASILFSPLVFVYGELMPKNLFYQAPNFLLRQASPAILFFAIAFAPLSALLWTLGLLLEKCFGQSPSRVRLALARKDLGDFLEEGHHAGILHPTQLQLAQNFFLVATRPVSQWMTTVARTPFVTRSATPFEALQKAQRLKLTEIAVLDENTGDLAGYLKTIDLIVDAGSPDLARFINPLVEISQDDSHGKAIMQLQSSGELMARVVEEPGTTRGVVTLDALTAPLLGRSLTLLHGQPVSPEAIGRRIRSGNP